MNAERVSILALALRCLDVNSDEAWGNFFFEVRPRVRTALVSYGALPERAREFEEWFRGWVVEHGKLQAARIALRRKQQEGQCRIQPEQERYFENYFRCILRSAADEFFEELTPRGQTSVSRDFDEMPAPSAPLNVGQLAEEVKRVLRGLAPELRVPFWLRYFQVCGPLEQDSLVWVASLTGEVHETVQRRITEEAERHRARQYPLSSEFIACLLALSAGPSGDFAAVDQRVRRALRYVQQAVRGEETGD